MLASWSAWCSLLDGPVRRPQVRQGLHVHQDAADAFGDRPDQGILLLEKRPGAPMSERLCDRTPPPLPADRPSITMSDAIRHLPSAKSLRDVLLVPVDDPGAGVLRKLPALGQTVHDALEKSVRRLEVHFAKCRDRIQTIQFLDPFPQGDLEFGLGAAAGRIRLQSRDAFPQSVNLL